MYLYNNKNMNDNYLQIDTEKLQDSDVCISGYLVARERKKKQKEKDNSEFRDLALLSRDESHNGRDQQRRAISNVA
jgi:hypothetical protein